MTARRLGELALETTDGDAEVVVRWLGRSVARDADVVIARHLDEIIGGAGARAVVFDFTSLEYMNSSTLVPIAKHVRRAHTEARRLVVRFRADVSWQATPFRMLTKIARGEHVVFEPVPGAPV
ncbi:MAG: hypothetical protein IT374_12365 [Polyangiaceae bacterium]|nr:hypothetical protein [Polyangiaceae bacterium]